MESLPTFLPGLQQLGFIGYWFVMLISLVESLVFTGIFVPGTIVVIVMGSLAVNHFYHFWILVLFSAIGASLGDGISYEIGRRHKMHVERWSCLKRHIDRARPFFQRHQRKSIVFGRFVGFVRPIVPFLAGVADVKRAVFYTIDILSAFLWSIFYIGLGYVFGAAWKAAFVWSSRAIVLIVTLLVAGTSFLWLWRWALRKRGPVSMYMFTSAFSAILFAGIGEDLLSGEHLTLLDFKLAHLLFDIRTPLLVHVFRFVTLLGEWTTIYGFTIIVSSLLLRGRMQSFAITLWGSLLCSTAITIVSKLLFHRMRPDVPLPVMDVYGYAFPSAHATLAAAFYGSLAYIVLRTHASPVTRRAAFGAACSLILLVDFSRMYLGVHYFTDVIAGNLVGLMILFLAMSVREWMFSKTRSLPSSL